MDRDKSGAVRGLRIIADLQEIEGANPFKVRAFRQAAETILASPLPLERLLASSTPGVGPSTRGLIRSLITDGLEPTLASLHLTTPVSVCELVQVPGIGAKTARRLYQELGIASLSDLEAALAAGRLHGVSGFGPRLLQRLKREIPIIRHRQQTLPIATAWPLALQIKAMMEAIPGVQRTEITGDARRLVVACPRIELIVAMKTDAAFRQWIKQFPHNAEEGYVDFQLESTDHPVPVRVYPTTAAEFAVRLMETTGDATHQAVIESFASQHGYQWTHHGLADAERLLQPQSEAGIYDALGLPHFPPEVREGRGVLCQPETLVTQADIHGDLHVHSTWSDGSLSIAEVVNAAQRLGYEYIAITDHSQSLAIAGGLSPEDLLRQRAEIERLRQQTDIVILHGTEVDILADGQLDLPTQVLWDLDIVVASIHSGMSQPKDLITKRLIRAIEHPAVDIIGHMTGRVIGRRAAYDLDFDRVLAAAAKHGVALELNANANRLDLSDDYLRQASHAGVRISIDTDTHHADEFSHMTYGIRMAHRGWLQEQHVLNTLPYTQLRTLLHQGRNRR